MQWLAPSPVKSTPVKPRRPSGETPADFGILTDDDDDEEPEDATQRRSVTTRVKQAQHSDAAIQLKTYTRWWSSQVEAAGGEPVTDLIAAVRKGVIPLQLLEAVEGVPSGQYCANPNPKNKFESLANLNKFDTLLKKYVPGVVNIGPEDLERGDEKLILALTWELISHYEHGPIEFAPDGSPPGLEGTAALIKWMREIVSARPYGLDLPRAAPLLPAALADGKVLCAVIHATNPSALDFNQTTRSGDPSQRLASAFAAAASLGVPALLDVDDVVHQRVDSQSVLTYVATLRSGLRMDSPKRAPRADPTTGRSPKRLSAVARTEALSELNLLGLVVRSPQAVIERTASAVGAIRSQAEWLMRLESSAMRQDRSSLAESSASSQHRASLASSVGDVVPFKLPETPPIARPAPAVVVESPPPPPKSSAVLVVLAALGGVGSFGYHLFTIQLAVRQEAAARAAEEERAARAAEAALSKSLMLIGVPLMLVGAYYAHRLLSSVGGGGDDDDTGSPGASWGRETGTRRLRRSNTNYPDTD